VGEARVTKDQIKAMVDLHVSQIREHVDSVRILVTFDEDNGKSETSAYDSGLGNFYAQLGQVEEWLQIQKQYQKNWAIRKDDE
jgi:hypothetical protein